MIERKQAVDVDSEKQEESLESALIRFLRKLFDMFRVSCTFEKFLEKTSEYFDEIILQKEERNNLKYAGGKIAFTLKGSEVHMTSKLYFLNESENWIVQESSNSVDKSRFNDWDTDEDLIKLSKGETVELDINHPDSKK